MGSTGSTGSKTAAAAASAATAPSAAAGGRDAAGTATFDLSGERAGEAVAVFDGVWLIATRHRPGLSKRMFEVNNRCFVFRLFDQQAGRPVLLVVNAVDPAQAIPEVRRLERETGLAVAAIVSPGGGHHLLLEPWHAEFKEAKILVGPERIPRTANGQKLMRLPRVAPMSLGDPLTQFRGQLDAVLFHGLGGPPDHPTPAEGAKDTRLAFMTRMVKFMTAPQRDPVDELWLHHVASGSVIAGENLAWHYPAAALRGAPFMLRGMIKPDRVAVFTAARKVRDRAEVAACWRRILAWPCRTLMTYHDVPATAFVGDGRAALGAAVARSGQLA
jgi:hypothetical protein